MPISNANSGISKGLALAADYFVRKRNERIRQNNLPGNIIDATTIDAPVQASNEAYIDIEIDLKKAPAARAFEYGSGIHAERGQPGYIDIPREGGKILAIPRERWPKYEPPPDTDPVFLSHVSHPGVKSKSYIRTTIQAERENIKKILGREFVASIRQGGTVEIIQ